MVNPRDIAGNTEEADIVVCFYALFYLYLKIIEQEIYKVIFMDKHYVYKIFLLDLCLLRCYCGIYVIENFDC